MLEQSTEKTPRIEDMEAISEYLLDEVTNQATSDHIGHQDAHIGSAPSSTYFSGALSPTRADIEHDDDDIYSRISPSALHMIIRVVREDDGPQVAIKPDFDVFYRIFPRWKDRGIDTEQSVYRKLSPNIEPVTVSLPGPEADIAAIERSLDDAEATIADAIGDALEDVHADIRDDPLQYSSGQVGEQLIDDFHEGEFDDAGTYRKHAAEANRELQTPKFDVRVALDVLNPNDTGPLQLKLSLENIASDAPDPDLIEHTIFGAGLSVSEINDVSFAPFRFTRLPEDYRYDRELEGYGINCSVERVTDAEQETLQTTCLPIHEQYRYRHREPEDDESVPRFQRLADEPLEILRDLKGEMEAYRDRVWSTKVTELEAEYGSSVAEEAREQMADFEAEIKRFERGIQVLEEYEDIRWAFELMNETFDVKVLQDDGSRAYDSWRLFQIVFIVSNLPDLAAREHASLAEEVSPSEEVSLLWFPTGGGKTEAYLGLVVTAMHFDRIRGKNIGLTSMMRYPLRLLSLQQFQRITELFMYADEIRERHSLGGDRYSVGYLTGGTENKLRDLIKKEFAQSSLDARDSAKNLQKAQELADRWKNDSLHNISREGHQFLNKCPKCSGDVITEFNPDKLTVDHTCINNECSWDRLPIYVIDNEIYRHLPTMVIGTQDKLAALGYERKFRLLLGHVEERCPDHGFTDGTECTEKYFCSIDADEHQSLYPKDPVPGLQIQDELHLVKEELGTFESHYWSAMEKVIEWSNHEKPKLIAATATIEAYENQISHLYQRDATLFPVPGPEYRESFYATEDPNEVQRYFLGITPWNRSHINSVVSILEAQQRAVQDLRDNFEAAEDLSIEDFNTIDTLSELSDLLSFYETAVNYVISKKEGARIYTSIETQINEDLTRDGYDEIDRMSLSGDSSFQAVSEMLDRFESLPDNPDTDTEEVIIATSTISHGVDLDALNFMIFFGMPRRTAEYIQSSSRVGRKYPGIIVDAFHPIRERDRSHFHYFDKYHEYQDWLVEPVPVNRWAKFSVKRTLPGLFMSLLLQKHYTEIYQEIGSPYQTKTIAKAHAQGMISEKELIEDLCEIYGTDKHKSPVFRDVIERKVTQFMSAIDSKQKNFVSDSLPGDHGTMFSLRDVDQSVQVFPTREDGHIVENLADKGGEN
ncbi:helicase-related protein [Natranaeroarchaeum aerophilus]|uniref:Helicase C-terminal domain-containing protein n=1 Tax=Natranaeroarchaeum aerophilus TaxID=2917711 RepID=A0AAE3FTJ9_9EURY|nr:helicase-related protein [Natranaeroarchaeum aerophilus]MCL9814354.1 hypothetical protein [Natranaeroarchaeum aerophilus]